MRTIRFWLLLMMMVGARSLEQDVSAQESPVLKSGAANARASSPLREGSVIKAVLDAKASGENLLKPQAWRPYEAGYRVEGAVFACDNGASAGARRGAAQKLTGGANLS